MGMMSRIGSFLGGLFAQPSRAKPSGFQGVGGTNAVGGFIQSPEKSADLASVPRRMQLYDQTMANNAIVGRAVRDATQLIASVKWTFTPAETPRGEELAKFFDQMFANLETPWHRVVRRMAMFAWKGFSIQEWMGKVGDDGKFAITNIQSRPQFTVEQWDLDQEGDGELLGVVQRWPEDHQTYYLPRGKMGYLVDDTLTDSPDGVGRLRHTVEQQRQLGRLEQIEGWAYETNLRGMPVGWAPIRAMDEMLKSGAMKAGDKEAKLKDLKALIKNHIRNPQLGITLDSSVYTDKINGTPSAQKMWGLELMRGDGDGLEEINNTIARKYGEIAIGIGAEYLLVGIIGNGAQSLSEDKTELMADLCSAVLREVAVCTKQDYMRPVADLNGWKYEDLPTPTPDKVQMRDVEKLVNVLVGLRKAALMPDDEAANQLREMAGIVRAPEVSPEMMTTMRNAALGIPSPEELAMKQGQPGQQPGSGRGGLPGRGASAAQKESGQDPNKAKREDAQPAGGKPKATVKKAWPVDYDPGAAGRHAYWQDLREGLAHPYEER